MGETEEEQEWKFKTPLTVLSGYSDIITLF